MTPALPIRFLGVVLGGWVCVRAAILAPAWMEDEPQAAPAHAGSLPARLATAPAAPPPVLAAPLLPKAPNDPSPFATTAAGNGIAAVSRGPPAEHFVAAAALAAASADALAIAPSAEEAEAPLARTSEPLVAAAVPRQPPAALGRWSASAWALVRDGEAPQLAPAGTLGGSQIGARIGYRLNGDAARPLSLQARAYAPAGRPAAAELGLGIEWKPVAGLPVRLLAERRQAVGDGGRSAFSIAAYGGVRGVNLPGPLTLDSYAQAGIVGARSRDLFAEASVAVGAPLTERIAISAAAWAGAQPGVSRLDVGPQLSVRLSGASRNVRLLADWRYRITGDAAPGSGPAVTLATDF